MSWLNKMNEKKVMNLRNCGVGFFTMNLDQVEVSKDGTYLWFRGNTFDSDGVEIGRTQFCQKDNEFAMSFITPILNQAGVDTLEDLVNALPVTIKLVQQLDDSEQFINWNADLDLINKIEQAV